MTTSSVPSFDSEQPHIWLSDLDYIRHQHIQRPRRTGVLRPQMPPAPMIDKPFPFTILLNFATFPMRDTSSGDNETRCRGWVIMNRGMAPWWVGEENGAKLVARKLGDGE